MKDELRVSVVMPVFDSARFLPEALASIAAQTQAPFEVIIVDGPSTDATPEIARAFPGARYLRQTGKGMWNALNEGIDAAGGEAIAFLSADDLWAPEKTAVQVAAFLRDSDVDYVGAHTRFVAIEGEPFSAAFRPELLLGAHASFFPEVLMVRRRLFDRLGRFDETLEITADVEWLSRLREARVATTILPEVLLTKRLHGDNLSTRASSGARLNRELLRIVRDKLARRREDGSDN